MDRQQIECYMERIGLNGIEQADLETLRSMQEHHIYMVPVENLDIIEKRLPISLEIKDLYDKVVNRRRGGLSFELNLSVADAVNSPVYRANLLSTTHPK